MKEINFKDGRLPGGRHPVLWVVPPGPLAEPVRFLGATIPGVAVVLTAVYEKAGIWSNTKYQILLADGVRSFCMVRDLHGGWGDHLQGWDSVAEHMGLTVRQSQTIVRKSFPETAARLDATEAALKAMEPEDNGDATAGGELVVFMSKKRALGAESECGRVRVRKDEGGAWKVEWPVEGQIVQTTDLMSGKTEFVVAVPVGSPVAPAISPKEVPVPVASATRYKPFVALSRQ